MKKFRGSKLHFLPFMFLLAVLSAFSGRVKVEASTTAVVDNCSVTTTASPWMGTYPANQSVTLSCAAAAGSACAATYYCLGSGCEPATPYNESITINASATLRFYSTATNGASEPVRSYNYTIDPSLAFRFERSMPQMAQPWFFGNSTGLAVDSAGNIYVAESDGNRIQKFDRRGNYLAEFGSKGSGNGQFEEPSGVAVDSVGNVYVSDTGNHRIQKFDSRGNYLAQFGSYGNGNGQFNNPSGVATDSSGIVYVVDRVNDRIQKFDGSGNYVGQFGFQGSDNGEFINPSGVAVDSVGNVYVSDTDNYRIQKFDSRGNYLTQFGSNAMPFGSNDSNEPFPYYPSGVAVDSAGNVYVVDSLHYRVQKFDGSGNYLAQLGSDATPFGSNDSNGPFSGPFDMPSGVAVDSAGNVYVMEIGTNRIQKFDSSGNYLVQFGSNDSGNGHFSFPSGVAFDSAGNAYVTDSINHRIQKFGGSGNYLGQFGTYGSGNGQFLWPGGVAVDSAGNVYVSDYYNNRVQKFGGSGNYLGQFGTYGSGNGQFSAPHGVAVDSVGNVYVADSINHRIQKFGGSGNYLGQFGTYGSGNGQFLWPLGVAVDSAGNVYVSDIYNRRIQKFDSSGNYLAQFGSKGNGNGQFKGDISGVAVDSTGNVYAVDTSNDRIQKFDRNGNYLVQFGSFGSGNGQFNQPYGVAVDAGGHVYVTDRDNHRIQKFTIVIVPPGTPTIGAVTAANHQATVGFTAPVFDGGSAISSYTVTSTPGNLSAHGVSSPIVVTGLENGVSYTFKVTATNSAGTGQASAASSSVTPMAPVPGLCGAADNNVFTTTPTADLCILGVASSVTGTGHPWSWSCGGLYGGTTANCAATIKTWNIVAAATTGGGISPSGNVSVDHGATRQFTLTASSGYEFAGITGTCPAGSTVNDKYTTGPITSDCTLTASFIPVIPPPVTTVSPGSGSYPPNQIVTLFCADNAGGACAATYYCLGSGCNPTTLYNGPVTITASTTLRFYSTGATGKNEAVRGYDYTIDPNLIYRFERSIPQMDQPGLSGSPDGVAVDSAGNVYVADTSNHRIQKFDSSGNYLTQCGSYGSGNGQFDNPHGIAVDAAGNIYVADTYNHRIQKLDSSGNYLAQFGSFGSGNGQFICPTGIAVDFAGNIYVAEALRIQKFDSNGNYVTKFGSGGTGNGQFYRATGIAVDSTGNVYVGDLLSRLQKFDNSGNYLTQLGPYGSGSGQYFIPAGVAVDSAGNVYISDLYNHRIQEYIPVIFAPGAPIMGMATAGNGQATVSFVAPTSDGGGAIAGYTVTSTPGNLTAHGTSSPIIVTGLANGTSYTFRVTATNLAGTGPASTSSNSVTPMAPVHGACGQANNAAFTSAPTTDLCILGTASSVTGTGHPWSWNCGGLYGGSTANCSATIKSWNIAAGATAGGSISPSGSITVDHGATRQFTLAAASGYEFAGITGTCPAGSAVNDQYTTGPITSDCTLTASFTPVNLPPVTTVSPAAGTYPPKQSITLSCAASVGDACAATYYCLGSGCNPTSPYSGPISITASTTLRFYSSSVSGKSEAVRGYSYTIDPNLIYRFERSFPQITSSGLYPSWVAVDSVGNIYVADIYNDRIQKFDGNGNDLARFGSYGSGNGQLNYPSGVVVDAVGAVYVADTDNHRIQKLDSSGNYLTRFGSYGSGNGQLRFPTGVAVDSAGNVYVVDTSNDRIQKFDGNGNYLAQFGSYGSGNGQFYSPHGIAVDSAGNVYVADTLNHRIQKFDGSGNYVSQFGSNGSGNGQLSYPTGVTVDSIGNIYVADRYNHRIQKFDGNGNYVSQFGSYGSGNGEFRYPYGVAVDTVGNVYVADTINDRIQKFFLAITPPGAPTIDAVIAGNLRATVSFSAPVSDGGGAITDYTVTSTPGNLSAQGTSSPIVVTGLQNGMSYTFTVTARNAAGNGPASAASNDVTPAVLPLLTTASPWMGTYPGNQSVTLSCSDSAGSACAAAFFCLGDGCDPTTPYSDPISIIASTTLRFYSTDATGMREPVRTYTYIIDPSLIYRFELSIPQAMQPWLFENPSGVAVDSAGTVYVADSGNDSIKKFDRNGNDLAQFGSSGSGNGQFAAPAGVAVDPAGNLYVADTRNHRIQKFDNSGSYLAQFGSKGNDRGEFRFPSGVAVDSAGNIYVADTRNHRIQKFDGSGRYLARFGSQGSGSGRFRAPSGVAVDAAGNIYVADAGNHRIQKLDGSGNYVSKFGSQGSGNGQFNNPSGVAVDSAGNVYVADTDNHRIQKFDGSGNYLARFGSYGTGNGEFSSPFGVTVDAAGKVYVVDTGNHRIQKFTPVIPPGVPTVVAAAAGNGQATVSFKAPISDGGGAITGYTVTSTPGNLSAQGTSSPIIVTGLENGVSYTFTVSATNSAGTGSASSSSNSVTPVMPPPLTTVSPWMGTYPPKQSVTLSCAAGAGDACAATYYCLGNNCNPATPYSGPIMINASTTLRFYSIGTTGKSEPVRTYDYIIDPRLTYRFERNIPQMAQPWFFYGPTGVAVDSLGNVYVADTLNNRIQQFDSSGNYLNQFGSQGSANGQFSSPSGVAVDSSGNVYVADSGNHRIQKLDSSGNYLVQFGSDGAGNGQFYNISGVAIDSAGNVYVADIGRIQKFDSSGNYLAQFGSYGVDNGQFCHVAGVAVDSADNVYVADSDNHRIQKFDSSGNYLAQFGSYGSGNGQFNSPSGVAIDSTDNVYVADDGSNRMQKFDSSGNYLAQFGSTGIGNGQFNSPSGVAVDSAGTVYVADTDNNRIQKFDGSGNYLVQFWSGSSANGGLIYPFGVTVDSADNVYAADSGNGRIQKFDGSGNYLAQFGSAGSVNGMFMFPYGVAVDSVGTVYVADRENSRILMFDSGGNYVSQFVSHEIGYGVGLLPSGVAADLAGNVYVADTGNNRIQKFYSNGYYIAEFGSSGSGNGMFYYPFGVAVDSSGKIFVADTYSHRIQKFDSSGGYIAKLGSNGSGNGQFSYPTGVAVDSVGNIYVADRNNHRIQKFTPIPMPAKGDITGDGALDLADAISGLRILAGLGSGGQAVYPEAALNGGNKIGLPEVLYILQKVAGVRTE